MDLISTFSKLYWFTFYSLQTLFQTIQSGDQSAVVRLLTSAVLVYVLLLIVTKLIRALWQTIVLFFKAAVVCVAAFLGMSIYVNGWTATVDSLSGYLFAINWDQAIQLAGDWASVVGGH